MMACEIRINKENGMPHESYFLVCKRRKQLEPIYLYMYRIGIVIILGYFWCLDSMIYNRNIFISFLSFITYLWGFSWHMIFYFPCLSINTKF